jgi:hypothetical protein
LIREKRHQSEQVAEMQTRLKIDLKPPRRLPNSLPTIENKIQPEVPKYRTFIIFVRRI